jgi:hypothetical protein
MFIGKGCNHFTKKEEQEKENKYTYVTNIRNILDLGRSASIHNIRRAFSNCTAILYMYLLPNRKSVLLLVTGPKETPLPLFPNCFDQISDFSILVLV